ncbi:50s ribosomal protein l24 [Fusarium oxysporum f. sp. phaseoli]
MASWAPARPALRALASSSTATPARLFSTTLPQQTKTIKSHLLPNRLIPPYPYGERRVYKQSNKGLYGSARIRFGNTVAEKYNNKARRFWRPNVHVKVFRLPAIQANVKTRLTLRVLKTIRREGGLQEYLLKSKPARIKELGPGGWNLRWLLMQSKDIQKRFNEERIALGMPPKEIEDRDDIIHQATLGELLAQEFVLGDEDLADLEGIQELSDEDEALLFKELDAEMEARKTQGEQKITV